MDSGLEWSLLGGFTALVFCVLLRQYLSRRNGVVLKDPSPGEKTEDWDFALDNLRPTTTFKDLETDLADLDLPFPEASFLEKKTRFLKPSYTVVFCDAVDVGYTYHPQEYERKVDKSYTPLTLEEDESLGE
jgi:hypothetical protein